MPMRLIKVFLSHSIPFVPTFMEKIRVNVLRYQFCYVDQSRDFLLVLVKQTYILINKKDHGAGPAIVVLSQRSPTFYKMNLT